jgi:hypothetical protein
MNLFLRAIVGRLAATRARFVGTDNDCIDAWFEAQPEDEVDGEMTVDDACPSTPPHPVTGQ